LQGLLKLQAFRTVLPFYGRLDKLDKTGLDKVMEELLAKGFTQGEL